MLTFFSDWCSAQRELQEYYDSLDAFDDYSVDERHQSMGKKEIQKFLSQQENLFIPNKLDLRKKTNHPNYDKGPKISIGKLSTKEIYRVIQKQAALCYFDIPECEVPKLDWTGYLSGDRYAEMYTLTETARQSFSFFYKTLHTKILDDMKPIEMKQYEKTRGRNDCDYGGLRSVYCPVQIGGERPVISDEESYKLAYYIFKMRPTVEYRKMSKTDIINWVIQWENGRTLDATPIETIPKISLEGFHEYAQKKVISENIRALYEENAGDPILRYHSRKYCEAYVKLFCDYDHSISLGRDNFITAHHGCRNSFSFKQGYFEKLQERRKLYDEHSKDIERMYAQKETIKNSLDYNYITDPRC